MIQRIVKKFGAMRRNGLVRSARVELERAFLLVLARVYGFHSWHAEASASARPYRGIVASLCIALHPQTVVEVGCGLGYVLALTKAPFRYGYDIDHGAIRAARFLHGKKITFVQGDLSSVSQPHIDVLILVNWIHEVSPDELKGLIVPLLPRVRYLVLDAIDPDESSGYRFKHDFMFLASHAQRISVTRAPNEGRTFQMFKVMT